MHELERRVEEAREDLRKSYETGDWDYILACQIDVQLAVSNLEREMEVEI